MEIATWWTRISTYMSRTQWISWYIKYKFYIHCTTR